MIKGIVLLKLVGQVYATHVLIVGRKQRWNSFLNEDSIILKYCYFFIHTSWEHIGNETDYFAIVIYKIPSPATTFPYRHTPVVTLARHTRFQAFGKSSSISTNSANQEDLLFS